MLGRLGDLFKYQLERLLLRGMYTRLLIMAGLVGITSLLGGLLVLAGDETFHGTADAIWWAFLRLTDPGYLGDDQGVARRTISATLTVLGYVLFMGSLIAVMTQWLNQKIRELERGLTPIVRRDHVVVLGWTSRTPTIAREMFEAAGRVKRFLALHEVSRLHFVLMVEGLGPQHRQDLRDDLGAHWREGQIIMRSGSPLHVDHLRRVDYLHAAAILLPADDVGPDEGLSDASTIKTLRSIDAHSGSLDDDELPLVVTEIFDAAHVTVARRAYRGPLEVISSDRLIGRLLALTVLQTGLADVFAELLAYGEGSEVHIREPGELAGQPYDTLACHFPTAVLLGYVANVDGRFKARLCPPRDAVVREQDRLVLVARSHEEAAPSSTPMPSVTMPKLSRPSSPPPSTVTIRILVVGWSDRVPDLIAELASHHHGAFEVDVLASVPPEIRETQLAGHSYVGAQLRHIEGDIVKAHVIRRQLEEPYDRIVLVASDWLASGAQSDARTILSYLLVRDVLAELELETPVTVELMDESNQELIDTRDVDVIVSPLVIGRVLAHVALRRELRCVYDELFDANGPVVTLRAPIHYGLQQQEYSFCELEAAVAETDVLIGLLGDPYAPQPVTLNPDKHSRHEIDPSVRLLVLRRARSA